MFSSSTRYVPSDGQERRMEPANQSFCKLRSLAPQAETVEAAFEDCLDPGVDRAESPGAGTLLDTGDAGRDRARLDLDMNPGDAMLEPIVLVRTGIHGEKTGASLNGVEVDERHRQEEGSLDVDSGQRLGQLGQMLALATAGGDQWAYRLARPIGDRIRLGLAAYIRLLLNLAGGSHRG